MGPFSALAGLTVELRRRRVFRVAAVYAAAAWVTAQVADTFFPPLGIPEWSLSLIALVLVLGFPVALGLAWAFDLTPDGVRRTPAAGPEPVLATSSHPARQDPAPMPAILALPFADRSPDAAHRFLGDGITDELIGALAGVDGLRVVARTTAFALRDTAVDVRELGARLGITHVLEGSLRVSGDRLRVAVHLADAASGYAVWSQTFDHALAEVFALQEQVAHAVADRLRPQPRNTPPVILAQSSTADFEAYALYLKGRQQWNERTPQSLRRALQLFREAVARDGRYAHAHAGIADSWSILVDHGYASPGEGLAPARTAAATALALRPDLAETQASAALVAQLEGRGRDAETGFRAAVQRNPSYCVARHRLALLYAWQGRFDEAHEEMRAARRADPLSPLVEVSAGWIEYFAGRYDAAWRIAQKVFDEHPGFWPAHPPLALALSAAGRHREAVAAARAALGAGVSAPVLGVLGYVLGSAGRSAEARRTLARLAELASRTYVPGYVRAQVWAGMHCVEETVAELAAAHAERSPQLRYLGIDPVFERVRDDPRVRAIREAVAAPA